MLTVDYRSRFEADSRFHYEVDYRLDWPADCTVPQLHAPELHRVLRTGLVEQWPLPEACRGLRMPATLGSHAPPASAATVLMRVVCVAHGTPPLLEEWAVG